MGFFDKLKKGAEEKPAPKQRESEKKKRPSFPRAADSKKEKPAEEKLKVEISSEENESNEERRPEKSKKASELEGELAIDVYETDTDFVIQSTIAGVKAENLDITIENDIITVRGSREKQISEETKKYYYQECYWGAFSRQVILPEEVDGSKAEAVIKDGVLTLRVPKVIKIQKRKIAIKQGS